MRNKVNYHSPAEQQKERRKSERRGLSERRDMVRWEPEKPNRRKKRDRRKSARISWDEALKRRR